MAAPSHQKCFLEILQEIRIWMSTTLINGVYKGKMIHLTESHISDVIDYASELEGRIIPWTESHISAVIDYSSQLEGANPNYFSGWTYTSITSLGEDYTSSKVFPRIVAFFTQEFRQLFQLPNFQKLSELGNTTITKNELIAFFINFLVELLCHLRDTMELSKSLTRELRFLVKVLGDTPIKDAAELEQVHDLLEEFEAVANDAAGLVYSFIFLSQSIGFHKPLDALLKRIDILKDNIIKYLNWLPFTTTHDELILGDASVDSLFIVDSLLYDLEELMNRDDGPTVNVKEQIQILHQQLMLSQSLLKSLRVPPHNSEIRKWRALIRRLAYEAEYLINSFLVGDAPRWYLTIRLTHIIERMKFIITNKNYDLSVRGVVEDFSSKISLQTKRIQEVDDIVVGFEESAIQILDRLVEGRDQLQFISIFGMPGLGKTTFAKKLYNHPLVSHRFDRRSWCVVSQKYQRKRLLTDILMGITSELDKDKILNMDEETLVLHIYQTLKGRRYVIVMDDIWDLIVWDDIRRSFPDDGNGSRILFTTRNNDVAPPSSFIYPLPNLSNDQCWELLEKKVFHDEPCPLVLKGIGREIAGNCHGLPLAVVVIAGVLSAMDREASTWKEVGEGISSYLLDGGDNSMKQILELSYKHLPEYLKPCFLYFGVFIDYKKIHVRKLIRLWIARGFIHKDEGKSVESVAEKYLKELIDKSLVIVSKQRSDGGVKECMIHDLLYEFCWDICEKEDFLRFVNARNVNYKGVIGPFGCHARSFHGSCWEQQIYVGDMGLLRVLDFECEPPRSLTGLEYLVELRYLVITDLPESIGNLVNLECLLVMNDTKVDIPVAVVKMKRLKYLHFKTVSFFDPDISRSKISNIECLHNVGIYNAEILKNFPHLRKLECLCKQYEEDGSCRFPDLRFLRFLTQLESFTISCARGMQEWVGISLPASIKKLVLDDLPLPWLALSSIIGGLQNLEILKLQFMCSGGGTWETRDGEFQQLRVLKLGFFGLAQWDVASSQHFPKLQQLVLRDCYNLQEIPSEIGEIATLQLIEVLGHSKNLLVESARAIEEEQRDIGNEDLRVILEPLGSFTASFDYII